MKDIKGEKVKRPDYVWTIGKIYNFLPLRGNSFAKKGISLQVSIPHRTLSCSLMTNHGSPQH